MLSGWPLVQPTCRLRLPPVAALIPQSLTETLLLLCCPSNGEGGHESEVRALTSPPPRLPPSPRGNSERKTVNTTGTTRRPGPA